MGGVMSPAVRSGSLLRFLIVSMFAVFLGLAASSVQAQDNSSVTGVVTDASGGVIADATVTLSNTGIGYTKTTATNTLGIYEFTNVPPADNYSLEFSKTGFS